MADLKLFLKWLQTRVTNTDIGATFTPCIPAKVDEGKLVADIGHFFHLKRAGIEAELNTYRAFYEQKGYAEQLGEHKTLSFEEAFIIYYISLHVSQPTVTVEIGTQHGRSTRKIIDIKNLLGMDSQIICFDVVNQVKHFTPDEAQLILKDVTYTFRQDILEAYAPGMIFLDAHPYYLLKSVISGVLNYRGDLILVIHDCSRGLCNPNMTQIKDDLNITSTKGVWERHALAEILNVADPLSERLDNFQTLTHHLRVFGTPHGLAVILPKRLLQCGGNFR